MLVVESPVDLTWTVALTRTGLEGTSYILMQLEGKLGWGRTINGKGTLCIEAVPGLRWWCTT